MSIEQKEDNMEIVGEQWREDWRVMVVLTRFGGLRKAAALPTGNLATDFEHESFHFFSYISLAMVMVTEGGKISDKKLVKPIGKVTMVANMHQRKGEMAFHFDCFIALSGGYETLDWRWVCLIVDGYYSFFLTVIDKAVDDDFIKPCECHIFVSARNTKELALKLEACYVTLGFMAGTGSMRLTVVMTTMAGLGIFAMAVSNTSDARFHARVPIWRSRMRGCTVVAGAVVRETFSGDQLLGNLTGLIDLDITGVTAGVR
ncbi:Cytokinin riboside 5-monophosphate phosphoribohydrolase LOG5 [Striga hermonthica]|uniref:cytokinin riboside 5'-monophosphate phosphoribohydrolase n=1 Tax=Striga hermonthica TaxID=68872 RepID=A0A9N7N6Q0_STRHE|nr:Cytokinin riboside 5-monophosphate phosphoribohydrolase LOG5 [Striga hermonthica]